MEERVLNVLTSEEFKNKSTVVISKHLKLTYKVVRTIREKHELKPAVIESSNGVKKKKGNVGTDKGAVPVLRPRQQKRMDKAAKYAENLAKKYSKNNRTGKPAVLGYDELLGIAHEALLVAIKKWNKDGGRTWMGFAYNGMVTAIKQAFFHRHKQLEKERIFKDPDHINDHEDDEGENVSSVIARVRNLTGLPRIIAEKVANLDGTKAKSTEDLADAIATFFGRDTVWAIKWIERTRQKLLQGDA